MAEVVIMPKLGLTMQSGAISDWRLSEGDSVTPGMVIADIKTEKITYELEAKTEGVLLKIVLPVDEEADVGAPIAVIGQPGEQIPLLRGTPSGEGGPAIAAEAVDQVQAPAVATIAEPGKRVAASPVARKLAAELGVDISTIAGSGPDGRITQDDVAAAASAASAVPTGQSQAENATPSKVWQTAATGATDLRGAAREKAYADMRRLVGEHMNVSQKTSVAVTYHGLADVEQLKQLLAQIVEQMGRVGSDIDGNVMMTAAVVKASAFALEKMPRFNSSLEGSVIKMWKNINIGVAVALSKGLIVPVVKEANRKGLSEIAHEVRDLAERAHENKLLPDEISGGTFTVSTLGPYSSVDFFSPIINHPEAAILGIGRMKDMVVAVKGAPVVRATMGLSLTCDHRLLDGGPSAEFLEMVMNYLAEPLSLLV